MSVESTRLLYLILCTLNIIITISIILDLIEEIHVCIQINNHVVPVIAILRLAIECHLFFCNQVINEGSDYIGHYLRVPFQHYPSMFATRVLEELEEVEVASMRLDKLHVCVRTVTQLHVCILLLHIN